MTTSTKVGDRLSYDGELCTVRFVGTLPAWPNDVALGVEWDSPSKGKHSGSYNGVEYFKVRTPRSGSFLKQRKQHDGTRSVYEALVYAYGTEVKIESIQIGGRKMAEIYGFEKLQKMQKVFTSLKDISLSRKCIDRLGSDEEETLTKESLQGLHRLDLSFNLISKFDEVVKLLKGLNLEALNLTGNQFTSHTISSDSVNLSQLNLTMTYPSEAILSSLPTHFPSLHELSLCDNGLTDISSFVLEFPCLTSLNLSMNQFTVIPTVLSDSTITTLNLANNDITITPKMTTHTFPHIVSLDLKRNNITSWSEIDTLVEILPSLVELRMSDNPIFEGWSLEEVEYQVIARWPTLTKLNGVEISPKERENAELWFLSKVGSGDVKYSDRKTTVLKQKYGKRAQDVHFTDPDIVELEVIDGAKMLNVKVMGSVEVLRLKSMLSRMLNRPFLKFDLTYEFGKFKEHLTNETSLVSSYGFSKGQQLTVEAKIS